MTVFDTYYFSTINYVMVTDCGPYDYCSSGVVGEMTRGGWYALGNSSMYGTQYMNCSW